MKKCKNCGKLVFACCGNEPGDYCHSCEEGAGAPSKTCDLGPMDDGRKAGKAREKPQGRPAYGRKGDVDG